MPYVIGIVLSVGVAVFASGVGLDRDRAFYPTVMIVIASYYVLFAVMSGSIQTVVVESLVLALFAAAAVAGFRSSAWIVVVALAGHGVFDAVHGHVIENAGVPAWWPAWCLAYDVGAAAGLAWLVARGRIEAGACRGAWTSRISPVPSPPDVARDMPGRTPGEAAEREVGGAQPTRRHLLDQRRHLTSCPSCRPRPPAAPRGARAPGTARARPGRPA